MLIMLRNKTSRRLKSGKAKERAWTATSSAQQTAPILFMHTFIISLNGTADLNSERQPLTKDRANYRTASRSSSLRMTEFVSLTLMSCDKVIDSSPPKCNGR
jgi:hypothetical protein